jgi:hypothetical protein
LAITIIGDHLITKITVQTMAEQSKPDNKLNSIAIALENQIFH